MAPIEKEILRASATPQGLSVKGVADLASRMKVNRQRASAILTSLIFLMFIKKP